MARRVKRTRGWKRVSPTLKISFALVLTLGIVSWSLRLGKTQAAVCTPTGPNDSIAGTLELYPTFENIGARLAYTGDTNLNATAQLYWRPNGSVSWTPGMSMTRISNNRWAGSVLWLNENTAYDVRAVITDPDCGSEASETVQTRSSTVPAVSGRTWWVATTGSDTTGDGTSSNPYATLNKAATVVLADEEIRVRPGTYYQSMSTGRSGTLTAPIHLTADVPGVHIDGSDPAYLNRSDWRSDGGGIFSVPYTTLTSNRLVSVDTDQRLYKQATLADLQANANTMTQGFAIEGGRLYVKLEDQSSPNGHTVHVARYNVGLYVDASNWIVNGLDIRYFGTTGNGSGIQHLNGSNLWVMNNTISIIGGRGIFTRLSASNDLIDGNTVTDPRVGTWPWAACKAHDEEITGISNRGGRGTVIRNNTVSGFFDGVDASNGQTDENVAADADYINNAISGVGDDMVETDTISGINLRLLRNTGDASFSGISIAPMYQGPEYVIGNTITNYQRGAFKFSLDSAGYALIAHTTTSATHSGSPAVWPTGPYSNLHFRNNILLGNNIGTVNDDTGESQTGNDFNADLLYATGGTLFRWKNTNYSTIAALRSATGFELQGKSGNPLFVNAAGGNYHLQATSPAVDAGIIIPGVNDGWSGAAPDAGAFELNTGGGSCTESWSCGAWSTCAGGQQTRTCTDGNNCGTMVNRPPLTQSCTVGCTENWQCGAWSLCINGTQTRTCTDANSCGTTAQRPPLTTSCSATDTTPPSAVADLQAV